MARLIYWIVLLAIVTELAAVLLLGGVPAANMLQRDIGIGFAGAVAAFIVLVIAFFANRIIAYFFPAWHFLPSQWRELAGYGHAPSQQHRQGPPDQHRGGR